MSLDDLIVIDTQLLALLAGTVIPLLVALVSKLGASSSVKATLNLVLSVAAGIVAWLITNEGSFTWREALVAAVSAYLASGVAHHNLWKPTGTTETVAVKSPHFGLGSNAELLAWDRAVNAQAATNPPSDE